MSVNNLCTERMHKWNVLECAGMYWNVLECAGTDVIIREFATIYAYMRILIDPLNPCEVCHNKSYPQIKRSYPQGRVL